MRIDHDGPPMSPRCMHFALLKDIRPCLHYGVTLHGTEDRKTRGKKGPGCLLEYVLEYQMCIEIKQALM